MDWSERMNAAISYIEDNLAGEVDPQIAAEKAYCSKFHFQRMFFAVIGMTPAEYIRRRRLTLAARELTVGDPKVVDVALKYGYNSPEAFARAFRNMHGVTPTAARETEVLLTALPRISFHIALKGGNDLDYRIVNKQAFSVAGIVRRFTVDVAENKVQITDWTVDFMRSDERQKLLEYAEAKLGKETGGMVIGVCLKIAQEAEWSYALTVEKPAGRPAGDYEVLEIPEATWAVFNTTTNYDDITDCYREIWQEWFPSTGYEYTGGPELEVYMPGEKIGKDYPFSIWVPVVKTS